jgi:hypothetical protein
MGQRPAVRRLLWGALAVGIAVTTVVLPPLIAGTPPQAETSRTAASGSAPVNRSPDASATPSPASPTTGPIRPAASSPAHTTTTVTLRATSITTTAGSIGDGESVLNLGEQDLSGTTDNWYRYVEFSRRYQGYLIYPLPAAVAATSVTGIAARVNYRGPTASSQSWTFSLRDWRHQTWVELGDNELVPEWGAWKLLTFPAAGAATDYVSAPEPIEVQVTGGPTDDTADIDYLAVVLTLTATSSGG